MKELKVINVTDKSQLDKLYEEWALTIEGLALDSLSDFNDWIAKHTPTDNAEYYVTSGEMMNEVYKLSGTNAYPDDLTIVSVCGIDNGPVTLPRFLIGARWFTDIVDNNASRQKEIDKRRRRLN